MLVCAKVDGNLPFVCVCVCVFDLFGMGANILSLSKLFSPFCVETHEQIKGMGVFMHAYVGLVNIPSLLFLTHARMPGDAAPGHAL